MRKKLKINKSTLTKLEKASKLLCSFLDYDALMGGDIEMGGNIERTLNTAIMEIKGIKIGVNNESIRCTS